jgi:hypothetical protein
VHVVPLFTSGRVKLLNNQRMVDQLCALRRKVGQGGRESVDHPRNQHDDLANAACGLLWRLSPSGPASSAENWLEFYRRQVEERNRHNTDVDDVRPVGPEFGFSFSAEPLVKIVVPEPIATDGVLYGSRGGRYGTRRIGAQVIAEMRRSDAADLLKASAPWRDLNPDLARDILGETSA